MSARRWGPEQGQPPHGLAGGLVGVALVGSILGSLGAPLITAVATELHVSLAAAQWTLTITLFTGAVTGPVLGRLGAGPRRRTTVLVTLGVVAVGGLLTVIPLGSDLGGSTLALGVLLLGRALQGSALGVIALLMSVARDRMPAARAASVIATLGVASTVGTGVGYPLIGLIEQTLGLRWAYAFGLVLSLVALGIAWRVLPSGTGAADAPTQPVPRLDLAGAVLLGVATLGVLLVIAVPAVWTSAWIGVGILLVALAVLALWVVVELRVPAPLVHVRLLMQPGVVRANAAMLVAGVGMYLLFSLLTRYLQTPATAGYGFALPGVAAGAALIPFSVLGFVAGRYVPKLGGVRDAASDHDARGRRLRLDGRGRFTVAAVAVALAALVFALVPSSLTAVLLAMAVLGFGVGGVSAVMPSLVLADTPPGETASALAMNQLVRAVGFSVGSALAGILLAAATPAQSLVPTEGGYSVDALVVLPLVAAAVVIVFGGRADATRDSQG